MNWTDDVVEKVALAIRHAEENGKYTFDNVEAYYPLARAALSAITLHDIAGQPEVKALVYLVEQGRGMIMCDVSSYERYQEYADKALAPFTEASNDRS